MYRYDKYDQAMVDARVADFRDQTRRRIAGQLTDDQFKPLRLKNGLYLQLHAYMLRVAIPYGTLNSRQMRKLAHIARTYDRGYGHFTTRQNIQYNWIKLEQAPDILAELATVEMHAIQTSGESIRNVSADHYAGAAADEIIDPRPWAEMLRQMTTFHPEFSYLPRKFKIAVIAAEEDRAAMRWHDFGLRIVKNAAGEIGFEVYPGGGMGRTPFIAYKARDFLPAEPDLQLSAGRPAGLEPSRPARQHPQAADEDPRPRAGRGGIHPPGRGGLPAHPQARARFPAGRIRPHRRLLRAAAVRDRPVRRDRPLRSGLRGVGRPATSIAHKAPGYAIANISLKPIGGIRRGHHAPNRWTSSPISPSATASTSCARPMPRTWCCRTFASRTSTRSGRRCVEAGLADANLDLVTDIIACPGLDYCSLANARSIPVAQKIAERFDD